MKNTGIFDKIYKLWSSGIGVLPKNVLSLNNSSNSDRLSVRLLNTYSVSMCDPYTRTHTYIYIYIYIHTYKHTHIHTYTYTRIQTYACQLWGFHKAMQLKKFTNFCKSILHLKKSNWNSILCRKLDTTLIRFLKLYRFHLNRHIKKLAQCVLIPSFHGSKFKCLLSFLVSMWV